MRLRPEIHEKRQLTSGLNQFLNALNAACKVLLLRLEGGAKMTINALDELIRKSNALQQYQLANVEPYHLILRSDRHITARGIGRSACSTAFSVGGNLGRRRLNFRSLAHAHSGSTSRKILKAISNSYWPSSGYVRHGGRRGTVDCWYWQSERCCPRFLTIFRTPPLAILRSLGLGRSHNGRCKCEFHKFFASTFCSKRRLALDASVALTQFTSLKTAAQLRFPPD